MLELYKRKPRLTKLSMDFGLPLKQMKMLQVEMVEKKPKCWSLKLLEWLS